MGSGRKKFRALTPEETQLWTQITDSIKPLHPERDPPLAAKPRHPGAPSKPLRADRPRHDAPPPHKAPEPQWTGVDRGTRRKLKRGNFPVDAVLDLHGMTQVEAHGALLRFVQAAAARGDRCVRIITGKGLRGQLAAEPETRPFVMDERKPGVLRARVPEWLAEPPLRALVRGIESAGPRQGGSGALYVLLKRGR